MRTWTQRQTDAINARQGTVLVSAAAGSGKTSVLVERLIQRITDENSPSLADRLLVVTFTNAAAKEMKERTSKAVLDLIRLRPTDKNLQKQQMLIPSMNISTIHSFCSSLCREYFHLLDIAPDFKIISDKQREEMILEAVRDVVSKNFENNNFTLANAFSADRNDQSLFDTIIKLYEFTNSHLYPEKWLEKTLKMYDPDINIEETIWGKILTEQLSESLKIHSSVYEKSIKAFGAYPELTEKYINPMIVELKLINNIQDVIVTGLWDDIIEELNKFKPASLRKMTSKKESPAKIDLISQLLDTRKKIIDDINKSKGLFSDNSETCRYFLTQIHPLVENLVQLTNEFSQTFDKLKKDKKFVDYGDLEHMVIKLLLTEKDGVIVPSQIARELSSRFDEIMIDEYQDTNEVQDWIFRAISKNDNNKFMVGDLKQCVYSFRQAMPDIFISYKENFNRYDRDKNEYPATIILDQNFRSRENIIDSVNFIFQTLMSKNAGGVDYIGDEALSQGASYDPGDGYETQIDFIEKNKAIPMEISEARHIAKTIKEIISSGLLVGNGEERHPATFKDFAILLRNANKQSQAYAAELEKNGVPAKAQVARPFFAATEVLQVISFLQVIDNPNQDIPLLSVLMGPVYGFTASQIANFRINDNKNSIYIALCNDTSGMFDKFLKDMEEYRLMSTHLPSHIFIDTLYARTAYLELVSVMDGGEGRISNLRLLRQYANDYESSGYKGISGFVAFMERLMKNKSNIEGASLTSEGANAVQIMSIHKSKGLEFPVCIVASCGKGKKVETSDVILNSELGIGMKIKNDITKAKYDNFIRDAIKIKNRMDEMSEELRVLYVAATRAREKLIFVSTLNKIDDSINEVASLASDEKNCNAYIVKNFTTVAQWLLMCGLKHPNGTVLRNKVKVDNSIINHDNFTPWNFNLINSQTEQTEEEEIEETEIIEIDKQLFDDLQEKLSFEYQNSQMNKIPVKVTASAVVEKQSGKTKTLQRPAFLSFKGLTPAERGTAMHNFIQFCDLNKALQSPNEEAKRLVDFGFITKAEAEVINFSKVKSFLTSDIGNRIRESKNMWREDRFSSRISANHIDKDFDKNTDVILQGAVDCAFMENDKLYIVDFKTDRIDEPEQIVEMYGIQLKLYADALKQVKNCEIGGCYLYSFHLNKAIEVK